MLAAGWGRIINTGSMHALVASPYKSAYNAAKHGVAGFTKTVALEVGRGGGWGGGLQESVTVFPRILRRGFLKLHQLTGTAMRGGGLPRKPWHSRWGGGGGAPGQHSVV